VKIRIAIIAIIAVCAGTFALTQAEPAQADGCRFQYGHGYSANCLPKIRNKKYFLAQRSRRNRQIHT
jgi:hypothetical protein